MYTVTAEQIKKHREDAKASGVRGCQNGDDAPLTSLRGISWRPEDPMKPNCFCHDCRTSFDSEGTIDTELVARGDKLACFQYKSIILSYLRRNSDKALEDYITSKIELNRVSRNLEDSVSEYNKSEEYITSLNSIPFEYTPSKTVQRYLDDATLVRDRALDDLKLNKVFYMEAEKADTKNRSMLIDARKIEDEFMLQVCEIKME